jgi:glutamine amidotransferase
MSCVAIIDYGTGNIGSITRVLDAIGCKWKYTRNYSDIVNASHIIMPGVGHSGRTMELLNLSNIVTSLTEATQLHQIPILGICLGMQLMTSFSQEGNKKCLGWFDHQTLELDPKDLKLKVPNIGWHTLKAKFNDPILTGIDLKQQPFYFCHRYAIDTGISNNEVVAEFEYGNNYAAILRQRNLIGVQFHPEKSQEPGLKFFKNFIAMRRIGV